MGIVELGCECISPQSGEGCQTIAGRQLRAAVDRWLSDVKASDDRRRDSPVADSGSHAQVLLCRRRHLRRCGHPDRVPLARRRVSGRVVGDMKLYLRSSLPPRRLL